MAKHPQRLKAGALSLGLWLLAICPVMAAQSSGYLPAVGVVPLRFQPSDPSGRPAGWPPLPLPEGPVTNATSVSAAAPDLPSVKNPSPSVLPSPVMVAASAPPSPPDPVGISIPPLPEPASRAGAVIDMSSVLNLLSPAFPNAPAGSFMFPGFVPASPPPSSKAIYEIR